MAGLGAAGVDQGYAHAGYRAAEIIAKTGAQIAGIPHEVIFHGGVFLDNEFLKYGLGTFGDIASNLARAPGKTLPRSLHVT